MVDESVVHLTIEIVDKQGGWWMKCRAIDYWDIR